MKQLFKRETAGRGPDSELSHPHWRRGNSGINQSGGSRGIAKLSGSAHNRTGCSTSQAYGTNGKSGDPHGKGPAQGGPQDASATDPGHRTYLEIPDYFLDPQAQVNYTYVYIGSKG